MSNVTMHLPVKNPGETTRNTWLEPSHNGSYQIAGTNLLTILEEYQPITLDEMETVALQNRVDFKYVMPYNTMQNTLINSVNDYRVLMVNGKPLNHYRTLYFDTPGFAFFNMHVNGQAERYKVRSREYLDTHLNYLEVKHKTRKDRTVKKRMPTQKPLLHMNGEAGKWLNRIIPGENGILEPKIWNTFTRITLVNLERCERVTIDLDIAFYDTNHISLLPGVAVAEVKLNRQDHTSPFKKIMREQHIPTHGFSKYCMGTSLLYDSVKRNALKESILFVKKISLGANHG